jgi:putative endonuclease
VGEGGGVGNALVARLGVCPGCSAACNAALLIRDHPKLGNCLGTIKTMERRYFVYILSNRPRGVLYVGVTNDLPRRLSEHKARLVPAFTNTYGVTHLVYCEEYSSLDEARERERVLKRWRREWKFKMVENMNPEWKDLSDQIGG